MANITLLGASYVDVPAVDLPQTGGGTVRFYEDEPSDLTTKTITLNGTYSAEDDSADGYSAVTVNVQGGASMTEVANTYGTELVITSAPGSAPSATRHTLYFEFEDETTATVYAYYDSAFIGNAITATTPTTYDSKTVTLAQLDGVTWYEHSAPEGIPIGVELIDPSTIKADTTIDGSGDEMAMEYYYASDYTAIDPSMTFTYIAGMWTYFAFYTSAKVEISAFAVYEEATAVSGDSNTGTGTLSGNNIPSNAAYARLAGTGNNSDKMSLIRTA